MIDNQLLDGPRQVDTEGRGLRQLGRKTATLPKELLLDHESIM